jgi:hypothetical protein
MCITWRGWKLVFSMNQQKGWLRTTRTTKVKATLSEHFSKASIFFCTDTITMKHTVFERCIYHGSSTRFTELAQVGIWKYTRYRTMCHLTSKRKWNFWVATVPVQKARITRNQAHLKADHVKFLSKWSKTRRLIFIGKCNSRGDIVKNDDVNKNGTSIGICFGQEHALGIVHESVENILNYKWSGLFQKAVNGWYEKI